MHILKAGVKSNSNDSLWRLQPTADPKEQVCGRFLEGFQLFYLSNLHNNIPSCLQRWITIVVLWGFFSNSKHLRGKTCVPERWTIEISWRIWSAQTSNLSNNESPLATVRIRNTGAGNVSDLSGSKSMSCFVFVLSIWSFLPSKLCSQQSNIPTAAWDFASFLKFPK